MQQEHADTLSSGIICLAIKIEKLQQKIAEACNDEAQANIDMKVMVADLETKYQAKIKDLKEEASNRIQWF